MHQEFWFIGKLDEVEEALDALGDYSSWSKEPEILLLECGYREGKQEKENLEYELWRSGHGSGITSSEKPITLEQNHEGDSS